MFTVRPANANDAYALGTLVQESILSAPSSPWEWDELSPDPLRIGQQLIGTARSEVLLCHVVDAGGFIVGLAQALEGEFHRCRHAATGIVLVRPSARRHGVGRTLVRSMVATSTALLAPGGGKLTIRVSAKDRALHALLVAEGWEVEREVQAGLYVDGVPVVVRAMAISV